MTGKIADSHLLPPPCSINAPLEPGIDGIPIKNKRRNYDVQGGESIVRTIYYVTGHSDGNRKVSGGKKVSIVHLKLGKITTRADGRYQAGYRDLDGHPEVHYMPDGGGSALAVPSTTTDCSL